MLWTLLLLACTADKDIGTDDTACGDLDGDGACDAVDCGATDSTVSPKLAEVAYNGVDDDCDPTTRDDDLDEDGFLQGDGTLQAGDCDDGDEHIHPGADEVCDDVDNDCDGLIDGADATDHVTGYDDDDGDGYGDELSVYVGCDPPEGYIDTPGDCDDGDAGTNPGAAEICGDDQDNDCDGSSDDCTLEGAFVLPDIADAVLQGDAANEYVGTEGLTSAGDLDGDGDEEILVGAWRALRSDGIEQGRVWLVEGPVSGELSLADASADITVADDYSSLGKELGAAPDLDGDGRSGVWMGGSGLGSGGEALVFEGMLSGSYTDAEADATIQGGLSSPQYGVSGLAWPGDANGDGVQDVLVGSHHVRFTTASEQYAWLLTGPVAGTMSTDDAAVVFEGDLGVSLGRDPAWFSSGSHVAVGDLSGDGVSDYLISQPKADMGGVDSGGVYVVWGGSSYLSDGALDLQAESDGAFMGEEPGDWAGYQGAQVMDVDEDGYDDLLIGAPGVDEDGGYDAGAVYLIFGPCDGASNPVYFDLGAADVKITRGGTNGWFGTGMTLLPDATGDGHPDLAILGNAAHGALFQIEGPPEFGTWDVDDFATASLVGDSDHGLGWALGNSDADGDGLSDLLVGAQADDVGGLTSAGEVFVLLGRPGI